MTRQVTPAAELPITPYLDAVQSALDQQASLVLSAAPGAGKTTQVPLRLLQASWCRGKRLFLLEPRRAAAALAAQRMAESLGETVGQTVGLRTRGDSRVSKDTRLEVVTEGVFIRMLLADPALEGYAGVLFDEVHERNLAADSALALVLYSRALLCPDLRLVLMSATLDSEPLMALLPDAAELAVPAQRPWPVATEYRAPATRKDWLAHMATVIREQVREARGAVLAFLPGAAEIETLRGLLSGLENVPVLPLFGAQPVKDQQRALTVPAAGGVRVILATNLAESSVTIADVEVVVDSGLRRRPVFHPASGLTRLETGRISAQSASQRQGRAGRTGPGRCIRLWPREEILAVRDVPEIESADLSSLVLDLARLGVSAPQELDWLTPPPAPAWQAAQQLLQQFGALDASGRITAHGEALQALPLSPRLAHLVVCGRQRGHGAAAEAMAAVLDAGPLQSDLEQAVARLLRGSDTRSPAAQLFGRLRQGSRGRAHHADSPSLPAWLLAAAWPDRIAMQRSGARHSYLLVSGRGASLPAGSALAGSRLLVVDDLADGQPDARIRHAWPVAEADLVEAGLPVAEPQLEHYWDEGSGRVRARRVRRLGALVLHCQDGLSPEPQAAQALLETQLSQRWQQWLAWTEETQQWRARVMLLRKQLGSHWPDVSDAGLQAAEAHWLLPFTAGCQSLAQVRQLPLQAMLDTLLQGDQRQQLARLAPASLVLPTGRRVALDYRAEGGPVLSVRLQEMFGCEQTPTLVEGRLPVTLHLLSPARRPLAVTADLASFWANSYPEVRAEMRGRYPKHPWPEDPLTAAPTATSKQRRKDNQA